jgi:hypothetical protein
MGMGQAARVKLPGLGGPNALDSRKKFIQQKTDIAPGKQHPLTQLPNTLCTIQKIELGMDTSDRFIPKSDSVDSGFSVCVGKPQYRVSVQFPDKEEKAAFITQFKLADLSMLNAKKAAVTILEQHLAAETSSPKTPVSGREKSASRAGSDTDFFKQELSAKVLLGIKPPAKDLNVEALDRDFLAQLGLSEDAPSPSIDRESDIDSIAATLSELSFEQDSEPVSPKLSPRTDSPRAPRLPKELQEEIKRFRVSSSEMDFDTTLTAIKLLESPGKKGEHLLPLLSSLTTLLPAANVTKAVLEEVKSIASKSSKLTTMGFKNELTRTAAELMKRVDKISANMAKFEKAAETVKRKSTSENNEGQNLSEVYDKIKDSDRIKELISTETTYLNNLKFLHAQLATYTPKDSNLEFLISFVTTIKSHVETNLNRMASGNTAKNFEVWMKDLNAEANLFAYSQYMAEFSTVVNQITDKAWLADFKRNHPQNLDVMAVAIQVVQRRPRYELLLMDILKESTKEVGVITELQQFIDAIKHGTKITNAYL